ncbi:MAG: hypothetical protein ABL951_07970 [Alphaproteobacteria bacterium]
MTAAKEIEASAHQDYSVVGDMYHHFYVGLLLAIANRAGAVRGAEVVFRAFRRQQQAKFLSGLEKLGLRHLPPAVACAQYHYLSNALGGVKVEWIPENDRKSWVRFLPPRWMFDGVAVCGIPSEMSRATMRGWHANNGVALGNLRLGFVCTSLTTDAGAGLIGYYFEADHDLPPEDRLRFSPGERLPGPAGALPTVDWSEDHRAKVKRNYAMEYVRSTIFAMCEVLGPAEAGHIGRTAGRQIGMQFHDEICDGLGHPRTPDDAITSFAKLLTRLARAHGDAAEYDPSSHGAPARVRQSSWRFADGLTLPAEGFEAWNGIWEGLAAVHGKKSGVSLTTTQRLDLGDGAFEWRLREL